MSLFDPKPTYYTSCLVQDGEGGLYHIAYRTLNAEGWVALETGIKLHNVHRWIYLKDVTDNAKWEDV